MQNKYKVLLEGIELMKHLSPLTYEEAKRLYDVVAREESNNKNVNLIIKEINMESSFNKDLERGQRIEKEILIEVKKKYDDAYLVDGYCKEWDIHIPSEDKGVEVKYDPMSLKTGNLVVEIEYNDKPSALSTTKAYRWVFHTSKEVITTTPEILFEVIATNNLQPARFRGPGDPYYKRAYLIKKHLITATALQVRKIQ